MTTTKEPTMGQDSRQPDRSGRKSRRWTARVVLVRMFVVVTTLGCGQRTSAWRAGNFDLDTSLAFPAVVNCFGKRLVSRPEFDRRGVFSVI